MSEAKKAANKKWDMANRERKRYITAKSQAKSFVRNYATQDDLENLKKIIEEKQKN
ncbi:hypothetical protein [Bifidobacterium sp. M0353]|uniref:hypothetical protein n=1 Tax=Bifidobacterium sp. M0353 TaxID=2751006 RepID=UPI0018DD90BD|nr:hypothetical protein [Bifidobacterium sp. M0353]MBI0151308.1 hypothetical protein [Bifidobacterium sp. M0353]